MAPVNAQDAVLKALKKLRKETFQEFLDALTDPEEEPPIFISEVEGRSRADVRKLLMSRCGSGAVRRTSRTLRTIGCKMEAEQLETETADGPDPAPRRDRSRSPLQERSSNSRSSSPKALLQSVRVQFVDNVSNPVLNQLLDRLLEKKWLNFQEMESAQGKARADKARYVVDTVVGKGSNAALCLMKDLCELDPRSELCENIQRRL